MPLIDIKAYVLHSPDFDRRYIGMTSDLNSRLKQHNAGETKSTKPYLPWRVVYFEIFETYEKGREREKYFKSAARRIFLKKILSNESKD
jgi:putative endonuclease